MRTYFFVDEDGTENMSNTKPTRHEKEPFWVIKKTQADLNSFNTREINDYTSMIELPKGMIEKLIGYELKWEDDPISIVW